MCVSTTEIAVSTVTATATFGVRVDLEQAWSTVRLSQTVQEVRSPDGCQSKPPGRHDPSKAFGHHLSLLVSVDQRPGNAASVKLFSNGTLHITGLRSTSEIHDVASAAGLACGISTSPLDVRIRMINAHFKHSPALSRSTIVRTVASHTQLRSMFDPAISPAAKVFFCFDCTNADALQKHQGACGCPTPCEFLPARMRRCQRVVALIHRTGTVMLSGACSENHVLRAANILKQVLQTAFGLVHSEGNFQVG